VINVVSLNRTHDTAKGTRVISII